MDDAVVATQLENLDRRVGRIEQILPRLATRDDLQAAITPLATKEELQRAIAPLATKEELRQAIDQAVAPLATKAELRRAIDEAVAPLAKKEELHGELGVQKDELRQEIREEGERSRCHMDVLIEAQRTDIQLLAEHLSTVMSKLDSR